MEKIEKKKNIALVVIIIETVLLVAACIYIIYTGRVLSPIEEPVSQSDKNLSVENVPKEEEITLEQLYGTYNYEKQYTNEFGNKINIKLELTLNSDGTATYFEGDGYVGDKTKGTYLYKNGKITYTREYHLASNVDSANSEDTPYTDGEAIEIFTVKDNNTLQNIYRNQTTELKK